MQMSFQMPSKQPESTSVLRRTQWQSTGRLVLLLSLDKNNLQSFSCVVSWHTPIRRFGRLRHLSCATPKRLGFGRLIKEWLAYQCPSSSMAQSNLVQMDVISSSHPFAKSDPSASLSAQRSKSLRPPKFQSFLFASLLPYTSSSADRNVPSSLSQVTEFAQLLTVLQRHRLRRSYPCGTPINWD